MINKLAILASTKAIASFVLFLSKKYLALTSLIFLNKALLTYPGSLYIKLKN